MTDSSREIERKFRVTQPIHVIAQQLRNMLKTRITKELIECATKDLYFNGPKGISIVRLRDSWGMSDSGFSKSLKEITIKVKDRKSNFDRLEENVKVTDSEPAYRLLMTMYGPPKLELDKEERVIWTNDGMIISLALVNNDPDVFLEVEGPSKESVESYCKEIRKLFPNMKAEPRSLVEIFG